MATGTNAVFPPEIVNCLIVAQALRDDIDCGAYAGAYVIAYSYDQLSSVCRSMEEYIEYLDEWQVQEDNMASFVEVWQCQAYRAKLRSDLLVIEFIIQEVYLEEALTEAKRKQEEMLEETAAVETDNNDHNKEEEF